MERKTSLQRKTPLRAKTALKARRGFSAPRKGLKATRTLKQQGQSETALCKLRIQKLLNTLAIARDGGCVLRHYPIAGSCGGIRKDGGLILQAEHLNTRSRNISFGDMRNIVCLCKHHHINWKPQHSQLYWELIEKHIGPALWEWYRRVRDDQRPYRMTQWDWEKIEIDLHRAARELCPVE